MKQKVQPAPKESQETGTFVINRNREDKVTSIHYYNDKGLIDNNDVPHACAVKKGYQNGENVYAILSARGGKPYDPREKGTNYHQLAKSKVGGKMFNLRAVDVYTFDAYVNFLKSKNNVDLIKTKRGIK